MTRVECLISALERPREAALVTEVMAILPRFEILGIALDAFRSFSSFSSASNLSFRKSSRILTTPRNTFFVGELFQCLLISYLTRRDLAPFCNCRYLVNSD